MRQIFILLAVLTLVTACEKEEGDRLQVSASTLLLGGEESAQTSLGIKADSPWEIVCQGTGFEVSPSSGVPGEQIVEVRATASNTEPERRLLGRLIVRTTHSGRESAVSVYQRAAVATQTLLIYMPGQSLLSYYKENIQGICAAVNEQIPGEGRILICWQRDGHESALMQEVDYDVSTRKYRISDVKSYNRFNASSPDDVKRILTDVAEQAPARHYGLIIGCHGKAWLPSSVRYLNARTGKPAESYMIGIPAPDAKPTRSFGDAGYELEIAELAAILESLPRRFEYLLFDDCFMANIETLYDLRHAVDYIAASPCEIMSDGFPYDRMIPHLFDPKATRQTQLQKACWEFWNRYENEFDLTTWKEQSGCISMAVTSHIDALAAIMRRINEKGKQPVDANLIQSYEGLDAHLFFDLAHYVKLSCKDPALYEEFSRQFDRTFPPAARLHTRQFYSQYNARTNPILYYGGISVSEPSSRHIKENRQTAWYRATH